MTWIHGDDKMKRILGEQMMIRIEHGVFGVLRNNRTVSKANISTSTNATFSSQKGWFQLNFSSKKSRNQVYVRLNKNDMLEQLELVYYDRMFPCVGVYKGKSYFCSRAAGTRNSTTTTSDASNNHTTDRTATGIIISSTYSLFISTSLDCRIAPILIDGSYFI